MVPAFDDLNLVSKLCSADPFFVNKKCCWTVGHSSFHLLHYMHILDARLSVSVIALWEHIQVHPEFDSFSMKDSSRPSAYDLIVVTKVIAQCSDKPSLAFFVDQSALIILDDFSTKS
jgi:hypothetical protein